MEEEIDFKELFDIFWRRKVLIILITIIFAVVGAYYTFECTVPMYKSSTTLLLAQNYSTESKNETNEITQTDILLNQKLVSTYSVLIKSNNVLKQVLENLNMDYELEEKVKQNIEVKAVEDTQVIEITYSSKDPETAYKVANEVAKVFCDKVSEIYNISNVYILDEAEISGGPYNINHLKDIMLFAFIGLLFACMFVFAKSLFDTTVRKSEDIEHTTGLSVLAQVPEIKIAEGKKTIKKEIITHEDPKSPISEIFKSLRTNLQFKNNKPDTLSILVTSTMMGEGKSWISSNLGVAFAQSNKKVIIIDSDMRKGRLHKIFGTKIFPGLSNYLSDTSKDIRKYYIKTEIENLWIIPAGNIPPNPSELLSNERMHEGLEELKKDFDVIIFDSTPCMLVTDAIIISRMVDTTIIASLCKSTKIENLKEVQKNIENVGGKIAGAVINKIPVSMKKYKSRYYYYGERTKEDATNNNNKSTSKPEEKTIEVKENTNKDILNQIDEYLK